MKTEELYDHYKETCQLTREAESTRGRFQLFLVIAISILYLQVLQPSAVLETINSLANQTIGTSLRFSISVLQLFVWAIVFGLLINYFQKCVYVERQYDYIHTLESSLKTEEVPFPAREGTAYLGKYPLYLDWVYTFYTWIFPILIVSATTAKILVEWLSQTYELGFQIANLILYLCILYSVITYLIMTKAKK